MFSVICEVGKYRSNGQLDLQLKFTVYRLVWSRGILFHVPSTNTLLPIAYCLLPIENSFPSRYSMVGGFLSVSVSCRTFHGCDASDWAYTAAVHPMNVNLLITASHGQLPSS